jgi:hypothetical protein
MFRGKHYEMMVIAISDTRKEFYTSNRESILQQMKETMPIAWNEIRAKSSFNTAKLIGRYRAWCGLLGDEQALSAIDSMMFSTSDETDTSIFKKYIYHGFQLFKYLSMRYKFDMPKEMSAGYLTNG